MTAHTATQPGRAAPAFAPTPHPVQDRPERFGKRLDEHMEGLPRAERLPFLIRQLGVWERRYDAFQLRVDAGEAPEWGESATDYVITIADIQSRIAREKGQ